MKQTVVFIASLGHSGSTVLDLLLGGHDQLVGLGELYQLLKEDSAYLNQADDVLCSCGLNLSTCTFWSPLVKQLAELETFQERYQFLLTAFSKTYGENTLLIDSSKSMKALQAIDDIQDIDVKTVFIIRDVRGWTVSMRDGRKRDGLFYFSDLLHTQGWRAVLGLWTRTGSAYFLRWRRWNGQMRNALVHRQQRFVQVGYEELTLYPEHIAKQLCAFLDITFDPTMLDIQKSASHSILGNRMRNQEEKRQRLYYDNRWFYRDDWQISTVIFPGIMKFNRLNVYGNTNTEIWQR